MRWLLGGLIASVLVLLIAAAGIARHVLMQHSRLRGQPASRFDAARESDLDR